MAKLNPQITLETELRKQIYNALKGNVVESILKTADIPSESDAYWLSKMEGHCMKVEKKLLPDLFALFQEVKEALNYTEPVDLFVTGNSDINAFSLETEADDKPNVVNINSGLLDLMSNDELRFVIGHELGHLMNKDTELRRLLYFIYPPEITQIPILLQYKIRLHDQLAELVADRYGFLACHNLDACVSAFFKMASGLDLVKMNVKIEDLLEDNAHRLEFFTKGEGMSSYDHPVNPIRIQSINLFAKAKTEAQLDKEMDELIQILLKLGNNPLDLPMSVFIASVGLIVAGLDGEISESEINHIIGNLAGLQIFPKDFLQQISKGDMEKQISDSVYSILEIDPSMNDNLLYYIISLVLADKEISEKEYGFVFHIGQQMGFTVKEVARMFANVMQKNYSPSIASIS